ncbi:MAG: GGDEF domain-containing protein [Candidatus Omnitrophica bacterium]|nr:GGDEF domain-containing protein [Candidatus Omnitrophota bacterium]MDD5553724.1 GGDEF domain-containing protein [Candidatus Omnitrophota bacterium]
MSLEELIGAKRDPLTGCFTKDSLAPLFVKLGGEYKLENKPFSVLLIDLDRFKSFNDKYGHLFGDEALKYFSSSMRLSTTESGSYAIRYGGDEFVIVFPGKNSPEAYALSVKMEKNIKARPFLLKGHLYKMSFSGGIAAYPEDGNTIEYLIDNADKAMYFSKKQGHGRITQFNRIRRIKFRQLAVSAVILAVTVFIIFDYYKGTHYKKLVKKINKAMAVRQIHDVRSFLRARPFLPSKAVSAPVVSASDAVYLKNGAVLEGVIVRENERAIEIKLHMGSGEGSIEIQKAEIRKIERIGQEGGGR